MRRDVKPGLPAIARPGDIVVDSSGANCAASEPFALRILDESMAPELWADCVVIVDPTVSPFDGCLVLAELETELVVRTYRTKAHGFSLEAQNRIFPTLPSERVVALWGVVSQRAGTRRRDHRRYPLAPGEL